MSLFRRRALSDDPAAPGRRYPPEFIDWRRFSAEPELLTEAEALMFVGPRPLHEERLTLWQRIRRGAARLFGAA